MAIQVIIALRGTIVKGAQLEIKTQRVNPDGTIVPLTNNGEGGAQTRVLRLNEGMIVNIPEAGDKVKG